MAKTKKILVIDDDIETCAMIEQTLGKRRFEVRTTPDARSGYEAAKALVPDLIFINLLLPDTNGLKLSKAVHALDALKHVPVIMFVSSHGELDARYTVTIGIVDTLVKPLREDEIIAKAMAVLGAETDSEGAEEMIREISEEEITPITPPEEEEIPEEEPLARETDDFEAYQEEDRGSGEGEGGKASPLPTTEEEPDMPEKKNPADNKRDAFRGKDLFSEDADIFGEELNKSMDEVRQQPPRGLSEDSGATEDEIDLTYETKSAGPLRRIIVIAASVVIGLAIGIGGYLFFTAGDKQAPVQKQVAKVLPEPAPLPPAPPAGKPNQIPEIPVKQEPQKTEPAKTEPAPPQDAKALEPAKPEAKKEPVQKSEPEKTKKEPAPAAAIKLEEQKPKTAKTTTKKQAPTVSPAMQRFTVQAGLFENEANANTLAGKIREKGHVPAVTTIETAEKKTLYRVTIGTYATFKKAKEVSNSLNRQGIQAIVRKQ